MHVSGEEGKVKLTDHASIKVLHTTLLSDVAGDTEVQEDVIHVGVLVGL